MLRASIPVRNGLVGDIEIHQESDVRITFTLKGQKFFKAQEQAIQETINSLPLEEIKKVISNNAFPRTNNLLHTKLFHAIPGHAFPQYSLDIESVELAQILLRKFSKVFNISEKTLRTLATHSQQANTLRRPLAPPKASEFLI